MWASPILQSQLEAPGFAAWLVGKASCTPWLAATQGTRHLGTWLLSRPPPRGSVPWGLALPISAPGSPTFDWEWLPLPARHSGPLG